MAAECRTTEPRSLAAELEPSAAEVDAVIDRILQADAGADPGTELEPEWKAIHRAGDSKLTKFQRLYNRAFNAGIRSISLLELEEAFAAGAAFKVRTLLLGGADRTREILLEDLPPLIVETMKAGGDATIASAQARGSLFREGPIEQDVPPDPAELVPVPEFELELQTAQGPELFELGFFATNPRAINWAAGYSGRQIVEIDRRTRQAIQRMVADAFEEGFVDGAAGEFRRIRGINPRLLARRVRSQVGLTTRQLRAVRNLRDEMSTRVRGTITRAGIEISVPPGGFSSSQISRAASRYTERLHRGRALNISRTETITSANEGQRQVWLQAREDGLLTGAEKRVWIITPDDRLCPICRRMAGQTRGLEEAFDAGRFGRVMGPTAHPQCRCATGLESASVGDPGGTGSTPTIPTAPPPALPPPPVPTVPGTPTPARLTWQDLPGRVPIPRNKARRELVEQGLQQSLDSMPPALRARAIDALRNTARVKFEAATASTQRITRFGFMEATGRHADDVPKLSRLMIHMSRRNEAAREWAKEYAVEAKRLIAQQIRGTIDADDKARLLAEWRKAKPLPEQWRLATVDEFASTLSHELAHAMDFQQGTNITLNPSGITKIWRADNMQEQIWRAYYRGNVEIVEQGGRRLVRPGPGAIPDERFAYATTKDVEGLAETMRLYLHGDTGPGGVTNYTAQQFRDDYPELARWFEKNMLTTGGG